MTTHTQHFTITITYQGADSDTFDAATIGDLIYDRLQETDTIDRLDRIYTEEEPKARPGNHTLEQLAHDYTPALSEPLATHDMAVISAVCETIGYARGITKRDEYDQAIKRARYLATPIEQRLKQPHPTTAN